MHTPTMQLNTEDEYILRIRDTSDRALAEQLTETLFCEWRAYRERLMVRSGRAIPVLGTIDDQAFEQYIRSIAIESKSLCHMRRILFPGICSSLEGCIANPSAQQLRIARPYVFQLAKKIVREAPWE